MGIWTFLNPLNWFGRKRNGLRLRVRAELYDGDIHPVVDVEGVGPAYERQLAEVGILNTDQLLAHPAAAVAAAIDTPEKRVRSWQAMAELALVDGIGPQYAEALARGGVDGIRDLVARDARVIASEVNAHLDSLGVTVTGGTISETRVRTWQKAAEGMKRRRVTVRLFGDALPPVSKQALRDRQAQPNGHTNQGRTNSVRGITASVPRTPRRAPAAKPTARRTAPTPAPRPTTTRKATTAPAATATASRCAATTAAGSPCKRTSRGGSKYCASHKGFRAPAKTTPARKKTAPVTVRKTSAGTATVTTKAPAKRTATRASGARAAATTTRATSRAAPKTAKSAPKTTTRSTGKTPAAKTTAATARKTTAAKTAGRVHVTHNGYRLYQKGNRFYFSKKSQAEVRPDGAEPVYEVPRNREIKVTQNGLPVLKGKA